MCCLSVPVAHHNSRPRADTISLGVNSVANLTIQHAVFSMWCMRLQGKALLLLNTSRGCARGRVRRGLVERRLRPPHPPDEVQYHAGRPGEDLEGW